MKLLVTGHEGYIGAVMLKVLADAGHELVGLDCGYFRGCEISPPPRIPTISKDIRGVTRADLAGFDGVIHLAGLSNDPLGDLDADLTTDINLAATIRLAKAAKEAGVGRFIFSSSCSVYGSSDGFADEDAPLHPLTAYAESKARSEEAISAMADASFSPTFLRNATVYGLSPMVRLDLVLNNLVAWACTTGKVKILSDGSPWRPMVHVEDVSRAFAAVLEAPRERTHNAVFNVGDDAENYQVRDLAEIAREAVPGCEVEYAAHPPADSRDYRVDFSRIKRELPEFQPRWNARRGAEELRDAYQQYGLEASELTEGHRFVRLRTIKLLMDSEQVDAKLRWQTAVEPGVM